MDFYTFLYGFYFGCATVVVLIAYLIDERTVAVANPHQQEDDLKFPVQETSGDEVEETVCQSAEETHGHTSTNSGTIKSVGTQTVLIHTIDKPGQGTKQPHRNVCGLCIPIPNEDKDLQFPLQETSTPNDAEKGSQCSQETQNYATVSSNTTRTSVGKQTAPHNPVQSSRQRPIKIYRMKSSPLGIVVIVNNKNFKKPSTNRDGTEVDCMKLHNLFVNLGFLVVVQKDLTAQGIKDYLRDTSHDPRLRDVDSLIVIILTHGGKDVLFGVDGKAILIGDVYRPFVSDMCPEMRNKPKFFIINACRGDKTDNGSLIGNSTMLLDADVQPQLPPGENNQEPKMKDFLIAFSTCPDHVSWRHEQEGSWFIQVLVEVFTEMAAKHDVLDMLVEVNNRVSLKKAEERVQIPAPVLMLTGKMFLNRNA